MSRKEPVRFDSFRFRTFWNHRFGSLRFEKIIVPVRCGSACVFRTRSDSVRFGSVRFRVRFPIPSCYVALEFAGDALHPGDGRLPEGGPYAARPT